MLRHQYCAILLAVLLFSCNSKKNNGADGNHTDSLANENTVFADVPAVVTVKSLWVQKHNDGIVKFADKKDEVYLLLAGMKSDSTKITGRFPYGLSWSLAETGGPAKQSMEVKYRPEPLWKDTLVNGESVEITFVVMEEDQAKTSDKMELAAQIARETKPDDPTVGTAASISDVAAGIFRTNKDDFVGSFAVRISNVKGERKTEWKVLEFCSDEGTDSTGKRFDVRGAGAHYKVGIGME